MIIEIFCSGPIATNAALIACDKTRETAIIDAPPQCFELVKKKIESLEQLQMDMMTF